jgi:hypothetical protein
MRGRKVGDQLRPKLPKLAALMDEAEVDVLAYVSFPAAPARFMAKRRSAGADPPETFSAPAFGRRAVNADQSGTPIVLVAKHSKYKGIRHPGGVPIGTDRDPT